MRMPKPQRYFFGSEKGRLHMNMQEIEALVARAVGDADLRPEEIPSIELYLDQITSLVSEKRQSGSSFFADRELTKTMINNYSKDGLLSPIKGKKYSKEHILQMLLVYELKNTLSIGEIKRVLQNIYRQPDYDPKLLEGIYSRYLDVKASRREETWENVRRFSEAQALSCEREEDFCSLILGLSAMSSYLKNAVQILVAAHYPDLNAEKTREELEKREEAKRQKAERKAAEEERKQKEKESKKKAADTAADAADEERA